MWPLPSGKCRLVYAHLEFERPFFLCCSKSTDIVKTRQSSYGKPQEAYRPRRNLSKHNLSWGLPHPVLTRGSTPSCPGQGVPHPGPGEGSTPSCPYWGYPILFWSGIPNPVPAGYPRVPPSRLGYPQKGHRTMEVLWDGDGEPPGVNWQINWKHYLPDPSDAGSNCKWCHVNTYRIRFSPSHISVSERY